VSDEQDCRALQFEALLDVPSSRCDLLARERLITGPSLAEFGNGTASCG